MYRAMITILMHPQQKKTNIMNSRSLSITIADTSPQVRGLVRDGFKTTLGTCDVEDGQHGFWDNYHNTFNLLGKDLKDVLVFREEVLTNHAEQGQYFPRILEEI